MTTGWLLCPRTFRRQRHGETSACPASRAQASETKGFTLIEVLVALVITILAVGALAEAVAGSLRSASVTTRWEKCVARAQSHLDMVVDPSTVLGQRDGDDADGYHWQTRVSFLTSVPSPRPGHGTAWAAGTALYAVAVTISWHDGTSSEHFVLRSAKLGPLPGVAP